MLAPAIWAQDGIEFFHGSFAEAQNVAEENEKLIFMDGYATWCGPCKWMARKSFTDPEVGAVFNKAFVNLKMDMEKGEGPRLARIYRVRAYPTIFILNTDGEVLEKMEGALPPDALKQWATDAIKKHAPNLLEENDGQQVEGAGDMGSVTDPTALESALLAAIEANDEDQFNALSESILTSDHPEKEILFVDAQRAWSLATESPEGYVDRVSPLFESGLEVDGRTLNAGAWYAVEMTKDEDDLVKAAGWAKRSIELEPNYFNHDTYAQLLYRLGEEEEAKTYLDKAIEMAKEAGINVDESVGFIDEADSKE